MRRTSLGGMFARHFSDDGPLGCPSVRECPLRRRELKKTVGVAVLHGVAKDGGASLEEIEVIYRRRYPAFLRVAVGITGDEQLALDAVQDAFVGIVRSRGGIRRRSSIEAFAWRAVVNAARDRRVARPEDTGLPDFPSPDTPEPDDRIRRAIAGLPERQRLVLFLRYFADLEYEAIGQVMRVRPGTVAAALNSARAGVKKALEREEIAAWRP
jgi:RNA polymerase sigma-70 factor, ECF subfamily